MKKITLLIVSVIFACASYAQSNEEEIDLYQAAFGMEKKAIVANFVQLTDLHQDAFWELYDEYEVIRKENGKKRLGLLNQYVKVYYDMNVDEADAWTTDVMKLSKATEKLINTYYKKIKKATNPIVATQFYQIEGYILTEIRLEILGDVPFLGE